MGEAQDRARALAWNLEHERKQRTCASTAQGHPGGMAARRWHLASINRGGPCLPCQVHSRKCDQPAAQHGRQLLLPRGHVCQALPCQVSGAVCHAAPSLHGAPSRQAGSASAGAHMAASHGGGAHGCAHFCKEGAAPFVPACCKNALLWLAGPCLSGIQEAGVAGVGAAG